MTGTLPEGYIDSTILWWRLHLLHAQKLFWYEILHRGKAL